MAAKDAQHHHPVRRYLLDLAIGHLFDESPALSRNPLAVPSWAAALGANVPPAPSVPTYLVQGTADPLVLPGTNAAYLTSACAAGATIDGVFVGTVGHMKAGAAAAPSVFTWLQQRFAGLPAPSSCETISPVSPLRG